MDKEQLIENILEIYENNLLNKNQVEVFIRAELHSFILDMSIQDLEALKSAIRMSNQG